MKQSDIIKKEYKKGKILFAGLLIALGILFRTIWHLGPNVEFVTTATLLAAFYLSRKWAIITPLVIMVITDIVMGNTSIFIFTWSGYVMIGLMGYYIQKFRIKSLELIVIDRVIKATGFGLAASLWFYLWTNFGVWLLDSWGMYPKTITGLINCYILAFPFFKYNLIGNLIFIPMSFGIVEFGKVFILRTIRPITESREVHNMRGGRVLDKSHT